MWCSKGHPLQSHSRSGMQKGCIFCPSVTHSDTGEATYRMDSPSRCSWPSSYSFADQTVHATNASRERRPHTTRKTLDEGFLRRNPAIRTQKCHHRNSSRVNGACTEVIRPWFNKFYIPEIQATKPENRYNMDEAGIMEGLGENGLVVGRSEKRSIQKKTPGARAMTSFIECVSATGVALPPLVIFKGKSVQQQWFPRELSKFKNWKFTATKNGWTSDQTAVEWLKKIFIPMTQLTDPTERRLLVLDGHASHETADFMYLCCQNNIYVLYLPPHTSHVLQPLDLSVFSSLKHSYRKQVGFLSLLTDSSPVGKQNFFLRYQKARL